jgi:hypothetical protein
MRAVQQNSLEELFFLSQIATGNYFLYFFLRGVAVPKTFPDNSIIVCHSPIIPAPASACKPAKLELLGQNPFHTPLINLAQLQKREVLKWDHKKTRPVI